MGCLETKKPIRTHAPKTIKEKANTTGICNKWHKCPKEECPTGCYYWTEFHPTDKAKWIQLTKTGGSHKQNCATSTGDECCTGNSVTGRALRWVPADGKASATVRVDDVGGSVCIGVLSERYGTREDNHKRYYSKVLDQYGEDDDWIHGMDRSRDAWCYCSPIPGLSDQNGYICHNNTNYAILPPIKSGDIVRVVLDNRKVTFHVGGKTASIPLPKLSKPCDAEPACCFRQKYIDTWGTQKWRKALPKAEPGTDGYCATCECTGEVEHKISLGVSLYGGGENDGAKVTLLS